MVRSSHCLPSEPIDVPFRIGSRWDHPCLAPGSHRQKLLDGRSAAANRDPEVFPDADRVGIDHTANRYEAFESGIHRSIGSTLARMEMRVAFEGWLGKFPILC